jgi:ubiquinone/menaquinone biosynthesis C-methylase UbiE
MIDTSYVFAETAHAFERNRLALIERTFDPATVARLDQLGVEPGDHCLEVGAGGGSVARWLCDRVGERGRVVALDMETRFLVGEQHPALQVWQEDIRFAALPSAAFDLIHARYFFVHLPDFAAVFARVLQALKPGGRILVEEPDFGTQAAVTPRCAATDRVFASILKLYEAMQVDWAMARRLPELFRDSGLRAVRATTDLPLVAGGAPVATVMRLSVQHIAEKLVETGAAAREDIDAFLRNAADPQCWMYHYATVAVSGRKPG